MDVQIPTTNMFGNWTVILIILPSSSLADSSKLPWKSSNYLTYINKGFLWNRRFWWLQIMRTSTIWITKENEFIIFTITHLLWLFFICQLPLNSNVFAHTCCILLIFSYHTLIVLCLILTFETNWLNNSTLCMCV